MGKRSPRAELGRLNAHMPEPQLNDREELDGCVEIEDDEGPVGTLCYRLTRNRELRVIFKLHEDMQELRNFTAWESRDG